MGVLGVVPDGSLRVLERPRVVGTHTADDATALRFQASAQGVADRSFGLNHPKNYLAVPLAVYHDGASRELVRERVVGAVGDAFRGAVFLGLVETSEPQPGLTVLGRETVRFALREYGAVDAALDEFDGWRGSRRRFVDIAPLWGELTRRLVFAYPATELLVSELQQMHDDGLGPPSPVELVEWLHTHHPIFTVELFVRGTDGARERVLTADGSLRTHALEDGGVYHAPTVFQLKAILYHAGILTERGAEPSNLDPQADVWHLREPLARWR